MRMGVVFEVKKLDNKNLVFCLWFEKARLIVWVVTFASLRNLRVVKELYELKSSNCGKNFLLSKEENYHYQV